MSKRQLIFGAICFLVGILVGMEIVGNIDLLVRVIIIIAILLLLAYLLLPYLPFRLQSRRSPAQRMAMRRARRKP
ncbi:MAG TPA: hypothetical protein VKY19_12685 [Ktedonosporobacter sp.]|jgi:hypothetical protein|nr:hypothetical protein [Ktedonosporobacter sp.]HZO72998.1 hypothetical protein [Ktedonobacteraceae bacterium]